MGLAGIRRSADDAQDVALLHDEEILAINLDLGAGPFAEENAIAGLHIEGDELTGLVAAARADGNDLTLLRLLFRLIGENEAALRLFLAI